MTAARSSLAGLVLAGGQSSRMGRDKALITWQGKTLLDHARAALRGAGAQRVFIAGRPDLEGGLADEEPGGGPARAILAAARQLSTESWAGLLVVPVDMPGLTGIHLAPLAQHPDQAAAFEDMPLPLYLPLTSTLDPEAEIQRVTDLHRAWDARTLPRPADPAALLNINTPEDLAALDRLVTPKEAR